MLAFACVPLTTVLNAHFTFREGVSLQPWKHRGLLSNPSRKSEPGEGTLREKGKERERNKYTAAAAQISA